MIRRGLALACVLVAAAFAAQVASADPSNAKNSMLVTAVCGGKQVQVVVNGNGEFTPAHVVGSTSVFVPTAFDLTFSFTPTGGPTESETDVAAKHTQQAGVVSCDIPAALNTFTTPEGTFSISGTVAGFFTPSSN